MKIQQDDRSELNSIQKKVVSAVKEQKNSSLTVFSHSFDRIKSNMDVLTRTNKTFSNYLQSVNQHPDIPSQIEDIDLIVRLIEKKDESALKSALDSKAFRKLAVPKPRFIKDALKRNDAREVKNQISHVNLKQVYAQGDNGFYNKPNSFEAYIRNSDYHLKQIEKLKASQEIFKKKEMTEVAHSIDKRIKEISDMPKYLGFHQISPAEAAVISAKNHGLYYHDFNFIVVQFDFFEQPYWKSPKKDDKKSEVKSLLDSFDRKISIVENSAFQYQPRLYPLAKFMPMPQNVVDIVSQVENMQELAGCPVFDYYWVLMPSININHPLFKHKDEWIIRDRDQPHTFQKEFEAARFLDEMLVEHEYFVPVVLGERNGVCYFLCLFQ